MNALSADLIKAIDILNKDGVIAMPTETVYGLAGNAFSEAAVATIYKLKQRPANNPLIVHIGSFNQLAEIAVDIPPMAKKLMEKFWPGPLTVILKKSKMISTTITAGNETVAVRMPKHPIALNLLQNLNFPLVAPSANKFTAISPTSATHVLNSFGKDAPFIIEGGNCEIGLESTIVGFNKEGAILYRHGAITIDQIAGVCGKVALHTVDENQPVAPGMFPKHYSPNTKTILTNDLQLEIAKYQGKKIGLLLFNQIIPDLNVVHQEILTKNDDLAEAAKKLYHALHLLDQMQLDVIIAEKVPNIGLGLAINDKLTRASK